LIEMLAVINKTGLFPRNGERDSPFLLLDGHQSRTSLDFMRYVQNPYTMWTSCIGVPYGTNMWQPADSSEINGSFKMSLNRVKTFYLSTKKDGKQNFQQLDVIPILNMSWEKTIARKESNWKAILSRGWTVLNYILLGNDRLLQTNSDQIKNKLLNGNNALVDCDVNNALVDCDVDIIMILKQTIIMI
jgi:hypothetical protein